MEDMEYMGMAVRLAQKGCGLVNPNPMVGAVLVKEGRIIGEGYYERYGALHAERNAILNCRESPEGTTLYVTLEPCCHHGKTPPCTEAILQSGIRRVVIGSHDPNPLVKGKGIKQLREQGIEVVEDVLKEECDKLNEVFFHFIQTGKPYVVMKYAMTMDGKTAAYTGASKWITGEDARRRVHEDRRRYSAVMVGIGTVLADDPLLTCRLENGRNPLRIICDTQLHTPLDSRIVLTASKVPTVIATSSMEREAHQPYIKAGCRILPVSQKDGHLDLARLMAKLGEEKIDSVLLEGGGILNWSALQAGIVNKVQAYLAPKLLGGAAGKTPVAGIGVPSPEAGYFLTNSTITCLGEDILIESEVQPHVYRNH
ncbi:bifunctional diaminohydroxyphosphoribosylaminopyrimidine deaminase/5-amino-6-(5-phosphoribosylamino)uracil reductase RibD [Lacrimispora saccharolytica]|uniref:Riboflavin biosynthesis protein RibD n=1 Tax=Lacrimispora saccharolytica (strain ATCC 35040 / DSM 2544 / NRCC 2533 / WM1) TaxID=610130 RepID=D9R8I6_LACSW|nr:bifunctional diaminohydroxyphosphoribosylaminopyrimidine deaminase/5-amino-6-(5-phosphoribosylamino)uracil reductase RibD [Lacrimispora saccharolytica]ADL05715.1 riboflavin biosynthesis protein RibD [[Clostridium] saccharolyticum WM1]QRV20140.1 bifunctional diaminohydroxyphosphoribosylaminopyrimidine deaminase/5-amino-6-(5-phosphoribosylamino)uracil reductase RibD [Lacrimispora saccharolytica]